MLLSWLFKMLRPSKGGRHEVGLGVVVGALPLKYTNEAANAIPTKTIAIRYNRATIRPSPQEVMAILPYCMNMWGGQNMVHLMVKSPASLATNVNLKVLPGATATPESR